MAEKTKQQLVVRALQIIGVVGTGQEPSAENVQLVGDMVRPMLDRLEALRIVGVVDENAIELTVFEPIAVLLAQEAAKDFGSVVEAPVVDKAETDLRTIYSARPTYAPLRADYF